MLSFLFSEIDASHSFVLTLADFFFVLFSQNPWFFMYQPVSYRLQGRMGTRDQLRSMIHTCRKMGVRVYADAVINHMVSDTLNPHTHALFLRFSVLEVSD